MGKPKIRRLIWDIETSPNIGMFWQAGYRKTIPASNVIKEKAIICICYKWQGQKTVHSLKWDNGCDKQLLIDFIKVANTATELVAHNGDKFDLRWFLGRVLMNGIEAPPIWKTVDTLVIARKRFYLNANSLDYLSSILFKEHKTSTSFSLWEDILLKNCPTAMRKMVAYCKRDVELLERVYEKLAPFHNPKTHVGVLNGSPKWSCARCGCMEVRSNGSKYSAHGTRTWNMLCDNRECNGRYTISDKAKRDMLAWREEQRHAEAQSSESP